MGNGERRIARWVLLLLIAFLAANAAARIDTKGGRIDLVGAGIAGILVLAAAWILVKLADGENRRNRALEAAVVAFMFFIGSAIVTPVIRAAAPAAPRAACLSNVKQLVTGMALYASDHEDRWPQSAHWYGSLQPYLHSDYKCPKCRGPWSYALNRGLSALPYDKIADPGVTVAIFESEGNVPNLAGGLEMFVPRHDGTGNVAFADGSARYVPADQVRSLRWRP